VINVGQINKLTVNRITSVGMFLTDGEGNDVLLPNKYIPETLSVDDTIDVFIYTDSEDRIIATTLTPKINLSTFAYLKVKDVTPFGAFLEWGLEKDLFVPFKEQNAKMLEDGNYVVYLYLDEKTNRLVASNKINKFLSNDELTVKIDDEVDLLVFNRTDLGYKVIINNRHEGLIYHNEIFQPVRLGSNIKGFIKNIREDNKIDVALQKSGFVNMDDNTQRIMDYLNANDGILKLTDNSSPEEIAITLKMSKKNFKKAIGSLYKKQMVQLQPDGVHLLR
jgi:uncharacterized protein